MQAAELLASWNLKRFRACIGLSLIRPKILVGFITEGIAIKLEKSESDRRCIMQILQKRRGNLSTLSVEVFTKSC